MKIIEIDLADAENEELKKLINELDDKEQSIMQYIEDAVHAITQYHAALFTLRMLGAKDPEESVAKMQRIAQLLAEPLVERIQKGKSL